MVADINCDGYGEHMNTEREMPPLPKADYVLGVESDGWSREYLTYQDAYTDHQMREYAIAYAAQEVAREREACAKACITSVDGFGTTSEWAAGYVQAARDIAEGIRARGNT